MSKVTTTITRDAIREMVRTMHHGCCENWVIARTAARCARTLVLEEVQLGRWKNHTEGMIQERVQQISDDLRREGWFV